MWGDDNGPSRRRVDIRGVGDTIRSDGNAKEVLDIFRRSVLRIHEMSQRKDERRSSEDVREELAIERKVALSAKNTLLEWIPRAGKKKATAIQVEIDSLSNLISPPKKFLEKVQPHSPSRQGSGLSIMTTSTSINSDVAMAAAYADENEVPRSAYGDDSLGSVYMDIVHLQDVFQMMAQQVEVQGQALNNIESNVENAVDDLHAGNKSLIKASKLQGAGMMMGLAGAGLLLGPLGVVAAGVKGGLIVGAATAVGMVAAKQASSKATKVLEEGVQKAAPLKPAPIAKT